MNPLSGEDVCRFHTQANPSYEALYFLNRPPSSIGLSAHDHPTWVVCVALVALDFKVAGGPGDRLEAYLTTTEQNQEHVAGPRVTE